MTGWDFLFSEFPSVKTRDSLTLDNKKCNFTRTVGYVGMKLGQISTHDGNNSTWQPKVVSDFDIWLQVKMRGPDQPPKPTRDPDTRSRPAIQTDPDLTIQTDPDLTIQTYDPDPFVLCWLDIFFFKVLKSITLYYKVLLQYYFVLQSISLYYKVRCWVTSWILEKFGIPFKTSFQTVPDPFQTSSMESKGSVHSQPCCPRRKNRSVRPVQNHLIQFKSYMKWLSWFQALRSRPAEKTFYESGRSRRPDHRGTIQTRLSTHAHMAFGRAY